MSDPGPNRGALGWWLGAAACAVLAATVVAGVVAYRNLTRPTSGVFVTMVVPTPLGRIQLDQQGASFSPRFKRADDGLAAVETNVRKLLESSETLILTIAMNRDSWPNFELISTDDGVRVTFHQDRVFAPNVEADVTALFERLGLAPALIEQGPARSGYARIEYRIDGTPEAIAATLRQVLTEVYGVHSGDPLYFQFND